VKITDVIIQAQKNVQAVGGKTEAILLHEEQYFALKDELRESILDLDKEMFGSIESVHGMEVFTTQKENLRGQCLIGERETVKDYI
jgi:hypothetical protein